MTDACILLLYDAVNVCRLRMVQVSRRAIDIPRGQVRTSVDEAPSEAVHLELGLVESLFEQQSRDLLTLITLKLDDLAVDLVLYHAPVTGKLLLGRLEHLLGIERFGQTLNAEGSAR